MGHSPHPFRDSLVTQGSSRHRGLEVTVFAPKRGPRFRAYVHTPGWERVLVVSTAASAEAAMERADALLSRAVGDGIQVKLPAARRPRRLRTPEETAPD